MSKIDDLVEQARSIEEELQAEFETRREGLHLVLEGRRIRFAEEVAALQRASRVGLFRYVTRSSVFNWLAFIVIWFLLLPMVMLDLALLVYQAICFSAYGIPKVKRSEHIFFDRQDLPYLNAVEKLNCGYCSYANGLASYFREIGARTEQFWCPIKHARRMIAMHDHYPSFFEYGDAQAYRLGLERLREALRTAEDLDSDVSRPA